MNMMKNYSLDAYKYFHERSYRIKTSGAYQTKLEKAAYGVALEELFDNSCMDFTVLFSFGFGTGKNSLGKRKPATKDHAERAIKEFIQRLDCKQHIVCIWMGDYQHDGSYHLHGILHFEKRVIHPAKIKERWNLKHGDCHTSAYIKGAGYGRYGFALHEDWNIFHTCPRRTSRCKRFEKHDCDYIRRTALPATT